MSRRHHGRPHHPAHGAPDPARRAAGVSPSPAGPAQQRGEHVDHASGGTVDGARAERTPVSDALMNGDPIQGAPAVPTNGATATSAHLDPLPTNDGSADGTEAPVPSLNGVPSTSGAPRPNGSPQHNGADRLHHAPTNTQAGHAPGSGPGDGPNPERNGQCTAPQLRRFIKSRPYVPMHELRRRFGIDGGDDDVTPVKLDPGWVYVGLPNREGSLLGDLLRAGEIGYELSLDPRTPIVIGVYPMRPIPRG